MASRIVTLRALRRVDHASVVWQALRRYTAASVIVKILQRIIL